jgi:hypothetical protein
MRATSWFVWLGLYSLYVKVWIEIQDVQGFLAPAAQRVADGSAEAPFQYRFLVPDVLVALRDHLGISIATGARIVDGACLAAGALLLERLLRHLELEDWLLAAALLCGFAGLGLLFWGKFETTAAFAATTAAIGALVGPDRHRPLVLGAAAIVLVGTRTDLLLALGAAHLAAWWWTGRDRRHLVTGAGLAALGVAATVALKAVYPDARYVSTTTLQLAHNLRPAVWLTALAFLVPALAPYAMALRVPPLRAALVAHRDLVVPLLALVAAEVASVVVVGRLEEVRLFFPVSTALAVLGIVGWRAALSLRPAGADSGAEAPVP